MHKKQTVWNSAKDLNEICWSDVIQKAWNNEEIKNLFHKADLLDRKC